MKQIPFIEVQVIALVCYTFFLLTVMAAKRNRIINSFVVCTFGFLMWTSGSLLMRLQLQPGISFWYHVSLTGMFLLPVLYFNFIYEFTGGRARVLRALWFVGTAAIAAANIVWEVILPPPVIVDIGGGQALFSYDTITWTILIPIVFIAAIILSIGLMMMRYAKANPMYHGRFMPLFLGAFALFLGNILSVFPFMGGFPCDTLAGIINAVCMFYALYKRRLFEMTLLVSRGSTYAMAGVMSVLVFANLISPLERLIQYTIFAQQAAIVICVIFAAGTVAMYHAIKWLLGVIYVKSEVEQGEILSKFSREISKSLKLSEILSALVTVVTDGIKVDNVYVLIPDDKRKSFALAQSGSPLDSPSVALLYTNPCIEWLRENNDCLFIKDFLRTPLYKAMWQEERKQIQALGIECIVPLKSDDDLAGILLLTSKNKNKVFTHGDVNFLESVNSIGSIAINNARMYEKAYYEARMDDLTGLVNRKYFHDELQQEFNKKGNSSLALIILNLDDFKLYNQLYGNIEGDMALQKIAHIIRTVVGNNGIAARYSGKEFALIMPNFNVLAATNLAEDIRNQVIGMNKEASGGVLKVLTLSAGVCVYPYSATTVKQLIGNADMAVYHAKKSGKNKVEVYTVGDHSASKPTVLRSARSNVYSEYASTIYALTAAIDVKDKYTFHHSQNVAEYATALAAAAGLNNEHIDMIREAALLHDIGKIGIPESILNKAGKLTHEEYETMKQHVENSIAMIKHLPSLDYVIPAVIGHHERWDGKGYPRGIAGEDIPISARCLALADSFDAMTTKRSYKKEMPVEFALNEITRQAGYQFDPRLSEIFVELFRKGELKLQSS